MYVVVCAKAQHIRSSVPTVGFRVRGSDAPCGGGRRKTPRRKSVKERAALNDQCRPHLSISAGRPLVSSSLPVARRPGHAVHRELP